MNRLPLDRIKIDKSFITTIVKSEQTAAIVNTIAGLGHNLDVPITAEGVESEQIRNALADFGCSEAQGWLFGRAISADAVRSFLASTERNEMGARNPPSGGQGREQTAAGELRRCRERGAGDRSACHRCCRAANNGRSDSPSRQDISRSRPASSSAKPSACNARRPPIAGPADCRKPVAARAEHLLFATPEIDHRLRAERSVPGHCEVLAFAGAALTRAVDEAAQACERRAIRSRVGGEGRVPLQGRRPEKQALAIVSGEQPLASSPLAPRRLDRLRGSGRRCQRRHRREKSHDDHAASCWRRR